MAERAQSTGPRSARLMVVSDFPRLDKSESLTRDMLRTAGVREDEVFFTFVERYTPPAGRITRLKEMGRKPFDDVGELMSEIDEIKPNAILALDNHSLKVFKGKKDLAKSKIREWRGSIFGFTTPNGTTTKVIPSYHPSALLRSESEETKAFSYSARTYMQGDFNRAVVESRTANLDLPVITADIARTVDDLNHFLDTYADRRYVSIDIETTRGSCIPVCVGFAFDRSHGISVPLLNSTDFRLDDDEQARLIRLIQERIFNEKSIQLVGQNIKFDLRKLRAPFGFLISNRVWMDTGMSQHVLYPEFPKSLQFLASTWTRHPYYKDELKDYDPSIDSYEQVLRYNVKDVCITLEIAERMEEELIERRLHQFFHEEIMSLLPFYMALEDRGICWSQDAQRAMVGKYSRVLSELQSELDTIAGHPVNINSPLQLKKLLYNELALPERKNTDENTLVALISSSHIKTQAQHDVLNNLLDIRKVKRTVTVMGSQPDYDGKMRSNCNINGAANGRTSFNILKAPERPTKLGLQFQNITKHGEIGPELRSALIPSPGMVFGQIDLSQAEARVVAALARDSWMTSLFERGKDVHSITASWFFNKEDQDAPEDPTGITKEERFCGKIFRHMLHYDAKAPRVMTECNTNARRFDIGINLTLQETKAYINTFGQRSPNLKNVFYKEVIRAMNQNGRTLRAASGRVRTFFGLWDPNLYFSYIPSASVSDQTKFASVRLSKKIPSLEILLESHDSLLWQCYEKDFEDIALTAREVFETPIALDRCSLPRDPITIPTDIEWSDTNYKELRKWKSTQ